MRTFIVAQVVQNVSSLLVSSFSFKYFNFLYRFSLAQV